jgi:transcription termination/antitermination protein NusG
MEKWYVVQVFSSQENKVKRSLEDNLDATGLRDLIKEVLVPSENVSEVKNGQQKIVEKRLWPGYILVKADLTDDVWLYIKKTNGVLGFLGGDKATPLTDEEVSGILHDLQAKKETVSHKHKFAPGDAVKITDGVFVNFVGTVQEVFHEKGCLSVLVSIFGRDTRVDDLEFTQVEAIIDENS